MRTSIFIAGTGLLLLAAALFAWLYLAIGERTFDVRGRVAGFGDDSSTVIIEHEAVRGYMPAMTMPFTVREASELEGLRIGDAIAFRLVVNREHSWIENTRRLPEDALPAHPAAEQVPKLETPESTRLLEAGDRVPDVQLTSQTGETIRLADYRGQALVLTFIYTRCPIPDYCPLMSKQFQELQPRLKQAFGDRAQLLSISFDPEYDTPEVLRDYAARYTDDLTNWTFATGSSKELGRATTLFGVYTEEAEGQIVHNLTTALVGPAGRLLKLWRGNDWKTDDVFQAVRETLEDADGGHMPNP